HRNIQIVNNTIGSDIASAYIGLYGIHSAYSRGGLIQNNTVKNILTTSTTAFAGIWLELGVDSSTIERNIIDNIRYTATGGYGGRGLYVASGTTQTHLNIVNNVISRIGGDGWSALNNSSPVGIYLDGTNGHLKIYNNSVFMSGGLTNGSATVSAAIYLTSGSSNIDMRNNIFQNSMTANNVSANNYCVYSEVAGSQFISLDYNNYFASGPYGRVGFFGSARADLAAWKLAMLKDTNSVSCDPAFPATNNLFGLTECNSNKGIALPLVTNDITGKARVGSSPDIGAYEYLLSDASVIAVLSPLNNTCGSANTPIQIVVKNNGDGPLTNLPVSFDVSGFINNTYYDTIMKTIAGNATDTFTFASTLNTLSGGALNVSAYANLNSDENNANDTTKQSVQINLLPNPAISGLSAICANNSAQYTTTNNTGRTFTWVVSDGSISSGQGAHSIEVLWGAAGPGTVMVTDSVNASGCKVTTPAYDVVINANPEPVVSGDTVVCENTVATYSTPNNAGRIYNWSVMGGVISAGQGTSSIQVTWGTNGVGTVNVTDSIIASGCKIVTNNYNVSINPIISANMISSSQSIITGTTPMALTGSAPTGGNGQFAYSWITSATGANSGFTSASGSNTLIGYEPGIISANTWYKRIVSAGVCAADTSNSVAITVFPVISSNTISGAQAICYNSSAASLTGSAPAGGNNVYSYEWESSTSSSTTGFSAASGTNNSENYNPGVLTATTWYRRVVRSLNGMDVSSAIEVTVNPVISNNNVSTAQTICSGSVPATLTGSSPAGGNGPMTYVWESSTTSASAGFSAASGTNNAINYSSSALTTTTWFRRVASSGDCAPSTSSAIEITVTPVISANTVSTAQTICSGSVPTALTGSSPAGGNGPMTYVWESSTTSASAGFSAASGTNNAINYSPSALTATTWFRRVVSSGDCAPLTSSAVEITVNPVIADNTIGSAQTICTGTAPTALSGSTPTGGNGTYTYTWELSTSSASAGFTAASGTNNTINYAPGTLTETTWFRRTVSAGVCSAAISSAVEITVNPLIANNTISGTNEVCVGGTPATITGSTANGGNGTITYLWESSTTSASAGFAAAVGVNNTQNYLPAALTTTTWFRRTASAGVCNANITSAIAAVVNPYPTPVVSGSATICTGANATYSIASNSGRTYLWTVNGGTISSGQGTASVQVTWGAAGAGTLTAYDSVNATGCATTSSVFNTTITPAISNNTLSGVQTICSGSIPTGFTGTTPAGGNGPFTYQWQSSTTSANDGFSNASGTSTNASYTAPVALTTTTWYRRVISSGDCANNTSVAIEITVTPVISNNTISGVQTICTGSAPTSLTGSLPAGGNGPITYVWESSTTSSTAGFSAASGTNNSINYAPSTLTETTWFRRVVSSGDCAPHTSNAIEITVNPVIANNTISTPNQICEGSIPQAIVGSTATGGNGSYTYLWESSTTSSSTGFSAASGVNTNANYSPSALTQTTWFRRVVSAGVCASNTSLASEVIVNPYPVPVVSGLNAICENNSTSYSIGSNVGRTYTWTVMGGSIASGQGTASISVNWGAAGIGSVVVKDSVNATGCATTTAAYTVTKNAYPTPVLSGSNTVCSFSTTNFTTANTSGNTYKWVVTGGTIASGQGTNTVSINWSAPGAGSVIVTDSVNATGCATTTAPFAVSINNSPSPVITGVSAICEDNSSNYTTPFNSGSAYIWEVSGGSITSGLGTNNITVNWHTAGAGSVTVTDSILAGGCKTTTSPYAVMVNEYPTPVISGTTTVCISSSHNYAIAANAGRTYQWTINGGTITSGQGTASVTVQWTSAGTGTLVAYDSVNATGCATSSSIYSVTVNPIISANSITGNQTICTGSTPTSFVGTSPAGGNGSYSYLWESSTTSASSGFAAASGVNNTANYSAGSLTETTWYRRTVTAGVCASSISESISVIVNPNISNNTIGSDQTICHNTIPSAITGSGPIGGNGTYSYLWESSTVSSSAGFAAASGTNSNMNYTPGSLAVTTWFRRVVSAGVCNANTSVAIKITVQDTTKPTVLVNNIARNLDVNGMVTISVSDIDNGSSDNCGIANRALSKASFNCANVGSNQIYLIVTDLIGNKDSAIALVTIHDNVKPTVIVKNHTAYLNASGTVNIAVSDIDNGSSDNCSIASRVLSTTSYNCAQIGLNQIKLTVTDVNGNIDSGFAQVTVMDTVRPQVITQNRTVYLNAAGTANITAAMVNNGSTDACGIASLSLSTTSFTCANVGDNAVNLTVTDVNGNSRIGSATITILDTITPVVNTQNRTVYLNAAGTVSVTAAMVNNGSTDACGIASLSLSNTSFTCANVGANAVTLTVTDVNGNSRIGSATITVLDTITPVVNTQNVTAYLNAAGTVSVTAAMVNNGSTDACGIASLSLSNTSFTCANVGANAVTLTVTDVNGNVRTGGATITVLDTITPVVNSQNVTVYLNAAGTINVSAAMVNNGSTDACGIASLSLSNTSFTCANVGANAVTLTVTDVNGNVRTGSATITVLDTIAPVVNTQNRTVYLNAAGTVSVTAAMVNNGSTDACGIASLSLSNTSFTCANVGANAVTLNVTDVNGNSRIGSATITVLDTITPVVNTQNRTVYLNAAGTV
ncbi:MAG: hypothetical protein Q8R57_06065, partial [Bacteroidota bacterium]|nr:hypothetical protein [Bacteroidota bacterium]